MTSPESPRVSIAMATYNGATYLAEQLDSIVGQTLLPDELVACDDGSTDATVEILQQFAQTAPFPVRVVRNPANLGFTRNFEKAIRLCEGDIIFLADQDDRWDPDRLERVIGRFGDDPAVMTIINNARLVDGDGQWHGHTQLGVIRKSGVGDHGFITGCCSAHRRPFLHALMPIGEAVEHDLWINRIAHASGAARVIPSPLQDFRRHEANNSNWPMSRARPPVGAPVRSHFQSVDRSPRDSWSYARRILDEGIGRIEAANLSGVAADRQSAWIASLRRERDAFNARLRLIDKSRLARLPGVIMMLSRGDYSHFTGWRSALKDLVRP